MTAPTTPSDNETTGPQSPKVSSLSAEWGPSALALLAFALALFLCYRGLHHRTDHDLRTPTILLVEAALASAVALGYLSQYGSLRGGSAAFRTVAYGLWSAAVFRLVPPIINEQVLYKTNLASPDIPFVLLGAVVHGLLALALATPYAYRVILVGRERGVGRDEHAWHLGLVTVVCFFVVAGAARVAAELRP